MALIVEVERESHADAAVLPLVPLAQAISQVCELVRARCGVDRCEFVFDLSEIPEPAAAVEAGVVLVPAAALGVSFGGLALSCDDGPVVLSAEELVVVEGVASVLGLALVGVSAGERAAAAERHRIAQDLHDSVGQVLLGAGMAVNELLAEAGDRAAHGRLRALLGLVNRANRELRASIEGLLRLEPPEGELVAAIWQLGAECERSCGVLVSVSVSGAPVVLEPARQRALVRAVRESLRNVERHAGASQVWIDLTFGSEAVSLIVRDDGVGLGSAGEVASRGLGLRTMQRRIEDVGGEVRLSGASPNGVAVEVVVPHGEGTAYDASPGGGRR